MAPLRRAPRRALPAALSLLALVLLALPCRTAAYYYGDVDPFFYNRLYGVGPRSVFITPGFAGQGGSAITSGPTGTVIATGGAAGRRLQQQPVTPPITTPGTFAAAAPAPSSCLTVAQIIQQTPQLSLLRSALPLLPNELKSYLTAAVGTDFTFFAPSNDAIRSALNAAPSLLNVFAPSDVAGAVQNAVASRNATALTALISYHLVPGRTLLLNQLLSAGQVPTALRGYSLRVARAAAQQQQAGGGDTAAMMGTSAAAAPSAQMAGGGADMPQQQQQQQQQQAGVRVLGVGSEAAVVRPDLRACRGVVHVIDTLLLPVSLGGGGAAAQQQQQQGGAIAPAAMQQQQQQAGGVQPGAAGVATGATATTG